MKFDCETQINIDSALNDNKSHLSSVGRVILKAMYGMDIESPQDPVSLLSVPAALVWLTVFQK